jgi:hypothetical protein
MSLFATAKEIKAPAKSAKKNDKVEVAIPGLKNVAELDALIKSLTTIKATFEEQVKTDAMKYFTKEAVANGKQPENFRGTDDTASASVELRKRSTASALSDDEVELLSSFGITTEKKVTVNELYGINPAYAGDSALLEKVSKAISKFVPADFIVKQEERSSTVVTDTTMEQVFKNPKAIKTVLSTVTLIAIKPKLEETDIDVIFADVKKIVDSVKK